MQIADSTVDHETLPAIKCIQWVNL